MSNKKDSGWVYLLTHKGRRGMVRIGTTRQTMEAHMAGMNAASLSSPYECFAAWYIHCFSLGHFEQFLWLMLAGRRNAFSDNFFLMNERDAAIAIHLHVLKEAELFGLYGKIIRMADDELILNIMRLLTGNPRKADP
ncbi:hypothetical protein [Kistimonas scapharcae]